jgi:uncharacterized membrane protein
MRALPVLVFLPFLAACEGDPAPTPEPVVADPVIRKAEEQRSTHLAGSASTGDFKVNFGEPFIQLENRGTRMSISQSYAGARYRVVDVERTSDGETWVFRGSEGAVPGEQPFVLTIEKGPCTNQFSGERTQYRAWLGTGANPRMARSCAAPAR